jgi:DNA-binding NarL/FixJ family response regulator
MHVRVAIADPLPTFRRGMQTVLGDAGLASEIFESQAPDDLHAWLDDEERKVVLMTLDSADSWELFAELHRNEPRAVLVAMLDDLVLADYVRAVEAGAAAAIRRDAPPDEVCRVFRAAVDGQSVLPTGILRAIVANRPPPGQEPDIPNDDELTWLRQLARGGTVAGLAKDAGYSERMMFRLLRDLYTRLGATNRAEALLRAQKRGWL